MKKLDPTLLREAAAFIGYPGWIRSDDVEFMCWAIEEAQGGFPDRQEFVALLKKHAVSNGGTLSYHPCGNRRRKLCFFDGSDRDKQSVRFMFLNLLAYAWRDLQ